MIFSIDSSLLEAVVLSIIFINDIHGYELTRKINDIVEVSDSTLYPILRRLQKIDYLESYSEKYLGRNRRYYSITEKGKTQLMFYKEEWTKYKAKIDMIFDKVIILEI